MQENQKKTIYLDRNENQYGPAPACMDTLKNLDHVELFEYSRDFSRGVKSRLTVRLSNDFGIEEKNVMLGFGGEDILKQIVHCYLIKGDKIMLPAYSWWYYKKIAEEVEGVKVEYPIVEGENTFYYDIDGMLDIYQKEKPKIVLISSPNNPTGNRLELNQLKHVLHIMRDTVVVLDEAYALFYNNDVSHIKELIATNPNLIIIRTFSKYYGLAGIRIGYAMLGDNHEHFNMFSARYLGYNRVSELIGIAALDATDYYESMKANMNADNEMFYNKFNSMPGFRAFKSYANFILIEIPAHLKDGMKKYLTDRNMIIKFMAEDGLFNHLRITIGTQAQNKMLMEMIEDFLKEEETKKNELAIGI
jgi:histidinol-phosphate aminotransferase